MNNNSSLTKEQIQDKIFELKMELKEFEVINGNGEPIGTKFMKGLYKACKRQFATFSIISKSYSILMI